jgi:hypothetical protein
MIAAIHIKSILKVGRLLVLTYALYKKQVLRMILGFYTIPPISTLL